MFEDTLALTKINLNNDLFYIVIGSLEELSKHLSYRISY